MRVIFYGKFADSIAPEIDFDLPAMCTVAELRTQLDRVFPKIGLRERHVRACVAGAIASDDTMLRPDQAVEILAPVSGG